MEIGFGVHTRNWPRIYLQHLEFNFEFYLWRLGGGGLFAELKQRFKILGLYIKLKTCSRSQKLIQNNYFD